MNIGMRILAAAVLSAAISFPASRDRGQVFHRRLREPRTSTSGSVPPAPRSGSERHGR